MRKLDIAAAILLTLAAFLLTLWRFGANQCFMIVAIMVILYRPWRKELFSWAWIKNPVLFIPLILIGLAVLSLSYTQAPVLGKALQGVTIYTKLLFLLLFPLALRAARYRKWVENGLIYGVLINVVLSTLYYAHVPGVFSLLAPHMSMDITYAVNPLQMIYIVALAIWILALRCVHREYHWNDIVILIVLMVYLWLINMERSGYLLFIALFLLLLAERFGIKAFLGGCVILPILLLGLYEVSGNIQSRVDLGIHNVMAFHQTENVGAIGADNSLGLRLAFTVESLKVIENYPLLGTGAGSFKFVHAALYPEQEKSFPANDPHEAYIYVAFELGLLGLSLYLAWLFAIWHFTGKLPPKEQQMVRGLWLMFVVMGLTDSGLALNAVGMSFVLFLSLYLRGVNNVDCTDSRLQSHS
jgi:O-antigen ligase